MKYLIIKTIEFYQVFLSFDNGILRLFTPSIVCRYQIHCSEYTKRKILKDGIIKGGFKGLKRILSCNPFVISYADR